MLEDFDVLPLSSLQTHSIHRRDVQTETHVEKVLSFDAMQRSEVTAHSLETTNNCRRQQRVLVFVGTSDFT